MTSQFYDDLVKNIENYNRGHEPIESSILKICKLPAEHPGLIAPGLCLLCLIGSVVYLIYFGGV